LDSIFDILAYSDFRESVSDHTLFLRNDCNSLIEKVEIGNISVNRFTNEYWTSKQRKAHSLHEISYRACFKPQLPNFFINKYTKVGDIVYDPFAGRGTTLLEAALLGRNVILNDVNPLSIIFTKPRIFVPTLDEVIDRVLEIRFGKYEEKFDLSMFYHHDTLNEIISLREYIQLRKKEGNYDHVDAWIQMVATNRLTGHSSGFFSVYTLPPNQAITPDRQKLINLKRNLVPEYRNTKKIIIDKSAQLLKKLTLIDKQNLWNVAQKSLFCNQKAHNTSEICDETVDLVVTSPPFLDVVQYASDNWLRCWFNSIDISQIESNITILKKISDWNSYMSLVFNELFRVTKAGGHIAFEVGEVKNGKINLDEHIVEIGISAGFECEAIMINKQEFTKTAAIWGVKNNVKGTNTNRIVIFKK